MNNNRNNNSPPKTLLEAVRQVARLRHLARSTEQSYLFWIRYFIRFHKKRSPREMGEQEIEAFLSYLAINEEVAPSTQSQALNAIVFLFRHVLEVDLGEFKNIQWSKRKLRIPDVLTREETALLLSKFRRGTQQKLIAHLLYGCGLRLAEALNLRIKDINFGQNIVIVRDSKGSKDRTVPLPKLLQSPLHHQIERSKRIHQADLKAGYGKASLPYALLKKYPAAGVSPLWQYVFPSYKRSVDPRSGEIKRHHLYDSIMEDALRDAVKASKLEKKINCHSFRHAYATHLLESGKNIREIQELLGHSDVKTTMIYTHVAKGPAPQCESPLDTLPTAAEIAKKPTPDNSVTILPAPSPKTDLTLELETSPPVEFSRRAEQSESSSNDQKVSAATFPSRVTDSMENATKGFGIFQFFKCVSKWITLLFSRAATNRIT